MKKKTVKNKFIYISLSFLFLALSSCDEDLPGVGDIPDLTPPEAIFSYSANDADYLEIMFANESISATDYIWDFGDGNSSTEEHPNNMYASIGTYTTTLTASDKLGVISTFSEEVEVIEPIFVFEPEILNPGFDIEGNDSYRDHWRNTPLGGPIQITGSRHEGTKAAKLPTSSDRIAYQLITVERNKSYTVYFYYRLKTTPVGSLTVAILEGDITDVADVAAATINSTTITDQSDVFTQGSVTFNSGDSTEVAIYVTNINVESRVDTFRITEN